jgi:hypothetical protein
MNMFQEDRQTFAVPNPAVVGTDLTTVMKRALITENYGVQKSFVLYPMKHLHDHNYPRFYYIITVQNTVHVL